MKYYLVSNSCDEKVIGRHYQTKGQYYKTIPDFSNDEFIDVDEPWGFILEDGAILTDVINTGSFTARGFFINEKVKNIFEQFNLYNHKFYPANLVYNNLLLKYYWLNILTCPLEMVDFEKSEFMVSNLRFKKIRDIDINSQNTFIEKQQELRQIIHNNSSLPLEERPRMEKLALKKLVLSPTEDHHKIDLLFFDNLHPDIFISANLYQKLFHQNVTGLEIYTQDIL